MFKIVWRTFFGGMMLGALICLLFFSCAGIVNYKKIETGVVRLENAEENIYNNNNFIIFEKHVRINEDGEICYLGDECENDENSSFMNHSSSSGGAIRSVNNSIYALTAAHFCVEFPEFVSQEYEETEPLDEVIIAKFMGMTSHGTIEKVDVEKDLCLISFEHDNKVSWVIDKIKLAKKMPKIGEKVYTVAAPLGLHGKHFRLHFEGQYAGCDHIIGCLYTIPATFGSSGSLVLNKRGELISVISVAIFPFQEVAGGASVEEIREFLKQYKCMTGIKLY